MSASVSKIDRKFSLMFFFPETALRLPKALYG